MLADQLVPVYGCVHGALLISSLFVPSVLLVVFHRLSACSLFLIPAADSKS